MKIIVTISRIFVGVLFILSGLIKLNDPVGFSFKLEEYFSPAVLDLPFFTPYALALAIFLVIFEVVLGVLLLLGYQKRITLWSLLGMIVFFTFLTFYSAYFNKVTDCGCFGDAVKLTPWESFTKDVVLLILILLLFYGKKYIQPVFKAKTSIAILLVSLLACVLFVNQVINHLPSIDFRPYKIGANISEGMSVPADAPKAIFEYAWTFDVDGERTTIVTQGEYPTVDGEFIEVETKEIQKGYEPPIHDFTIEKNGIDLAGSILKRKNLLMVISYDLQKTHREAFKQIKKITDSALVMGYSVIGMSASSEEWTEALKSEYGLLFPYYFTDETTLKTIVRSNPGILRVKEGTIIQKLHYNDFEDLELKNLSDEERYISSLQVQLDSIMILDQKYRASFDPSTWSRQMEIDQSNIQFVDSIIQVYGYPGKSLVGDKAGKAAWYVIQHSDRIDEFLPQIEIAALTGELPFRLYAMMLDRSLMNQKQPQIYGTQGVTLADGSNVFWPIEDPDNVNERRKKAGFGTTIEKYAMDLFGPDWHYENEYGPEAMEWILEGMNK
ncbi:BT_3928 family protein [Muriicola sp. SD30]|uniref:BT_3928 family protein n=1 Tax=Muriicola sp. SD30 TaxID=3240936 RepID=UPI00350FE7F5